MSSLGEKIRFGLIAILDHFPDTCWTEMVVWALDPKGYCIQSWFQHNEGCKTEPYCGKCADTGRCTVPEAAEGWETRKLWKCNLKPVADFICNYLCWHCPMKMKAFFQGKADIDFR